RILLGEKPLQLATQTKKCPVSSGAIEHVYNPVVKPLNFRPTVFFLATVVGRFVIHLTASASLACGLERTFSVLRPCRPIRPTAGARLFPAHAVCEPLFSEIVPSFAVRFSVHDRGPVGV